MKIVAVIQTRMGASRLPGKVLMNIAGRPMFWHVVNRLQYSKIISKVVIATTTNKRDDLIEKFCRKEGIDCYRGSEDDVLDRYYQASIFYKADAIVRITSDCPLIDPTVSERVISTYLKNINKIDGSSNVINRTYPRGLDTEVISFSTLERIWNEGKEDYQREHVTVYAYEHPSLFNLQSVENNSNLSDLRWTVDEEDDLKFVREIYKRLYHKEKDVFLMDDVIEVLKREPQLLKINKYVKQKII